jgi:hypothetical protein
MKPVPFVPTRANTYRDGISQERCRSCLRLLVDCTCDPPPPTLPPVPTSPDDSDG